VWYQTPNKRPGTARSKRDGTWAETRFGLSAKRTSPFISAGLSIHSTAGSRGVRISGSNAGYTVFRYSARLLATHSIRIFPLHFPSRASPCAIRFRTCYTTVVFWSYSMLTPSTHNRIAHTTYLHTRMRDELVQYINQWLIHFLRWFHPASFLRSKSTKTHTKTHPAFCCSHDSYSFSSLSGEQKPGRVNGFVLH